MSGLRRSTSAFVVALGTLLLGSVVIAPQASAAAEPDTPTFGPAIDALASYQPQTTCSPTAKPGALAVRDLLVRTYGPASFSIARACGSSTSEHYEGRAVDWMHSVRNATQRDQVRTFVHWLKATDLYGNRFAMVRRLGVMYLIWNGRMWRAYDPARGWTEYQSCRTRYTSSAYDTMCHRDHLHMSLSWPGARKQTSWYTAASG
jgi:hypothetical protein